jgi:hypothetical protein
MATKGRGAGRGRPGNIPYRFVWDRMSAVFVLITGTLLRQAEEKTSSKTGRVFISATLKVGGETGDAEFWSITAFSQSAQTELLRLGYRDALSAQGKARFELWQPRDGGGEISRSRLIDS